MAGWYPFPAKQLQAWGKEASLFPIQKHLFARPLLCRLKWHA